MSYIITAIVFLLIFTVLVMIHELGHFWMARRAGIKVEEFGFGLPPRVWGKKVGETIYSINAIPFGGFVRMLGEDSKDSDMIENKRSFIAQSPRARILVVIAGVVMNFLLAWVLLVIGFTFGMNPLLQEGDLLPAINAGKLEIEEGLKVKSVEEAGVADRIGFESEDVILKYNGELINVNSFGDNILNQNGVFVVKRGDQILEINLKLDDLRAEEKALVANEGEGFEDVTSGFGLEFYDRLSLSRVRVYDLPRDSTLYRSGLRAGDIILQVNGEQVYVVDQYTDLISSGGQLNYKIFRDGELREFVVDLSGGRQIVISRVLPDSAAFTAGLKEGDVIVSINGKLIDEVGDVRKAAEEFGEGVLAYRVLRGGEELVFDVQPKEGLVGVLLSDLVTYGDEEGVSMYNYDLLTSVTKINKDQYPFYQAPFVAFSEMAKISKLTAKMFIGVVATTFSTLEVPEGVAGPVGIAQLTYLSIQDGFMSVLVLTAMLSLSLAVINILPLPALDGGRLLFILVEIVIGRRVNQKMEAIIHVVGYFLILLLILFVTANDVFRIFS